MENDTPTNLAAKNEVKAKALQLKQQQQEMEQKRQIEMLDRQIEDEKQMIDSTAQAMLNEEQRLERRDKEIREGARQSEKYLNMRKDKMKRENDEEERQRDIDMYDHLNEQRQFYSNETKYRIEMCKQEEKELKELQKEREQTAEEYIEKQREKNCVLKDKKRQEFDRYAKESSAQSKVHNQELLKLGESKTRIQQEGLQNTRLHKERVNLLKVHMEATNQQTKDAHKREISERNYIQAVKNVKNSPAEMSQHIANLGKIEIAFLIGTAEKYEQLEKLLPKTLDSLILSIANVEADLISLIECQEDKIDDLVVVRQEKANKCIHKIDAFKNAIMPFRELIAQLRVVSLQPRIEEKAKELQKMHADLRAIIMDIPKAYAQKHVEMGTKEAIRQLTDGTAFAMITQQQQQRIEQERRVRENNVGNKDETPKHTAANDEPPVK